MSPVRYRLNALPFALASEARPSTRLAFRGRSLAVPLGALAGLAASLFADRLVVEPVTSYVLSERVLPAGRYLVLAVVALVLAAAGASRARAAWARLTVRLAESRPREVVLGVTHRTGVVNQHQQQVAVLSDLRSLRSPDLDAFVDRVIRERADSGADRVGVEREEGTPLALARGVAWAATSPGLTDALGPPGPARLAPPGPLADAARVLGLVPLDARYVTFEVARAGGHHSSASEEAQATLARLRADLESGAPEEWVARRAEGRA